VARALRIEELDALLESRVDNPQAVLELLVTQAAKGQPYPELWQKLHDAATRDDTLAELAFAYEHLSQDRRIKLLTADHQAEVFLHATRFFADVFGDPDGAVAYAERVLASVPSHPEAISRLEQLLEHSGDTARLAKLHADLGTSEKDREPQLQHLRRAAQLLEGSAGSALAIDVLSRIVRLDPADGGAWLALCDLLVASGKPRDAAKLLEQSLMRDPPPRGDEARTLHSRLIDLYVDQLREPQRSVPHLEALLAAQPEDERARTIAESLLENRAVAARVAPTLSDVYEKLGWLERAAEMLGMELKLVRGPRRLEAQRRLAIIRQDVLGDPAGALELLGPVCSAEPGDDEVRRRFVELSLQLNQPGEAARLLQRALTACRDPAVRSRIAAEIGVVYLRSGDVKRAQASFQQVLEAQADDSAMLTAARNLVEMFAAAGDNKALAGALEVVARLEPDAEARHSAARRLARLCETEVDDPGRAINAWKVLVDSPWADEALRRLALLYEQSGDQDGQIDVMERRARRVRDPAEARELALRAAELRTERGRDRTAALGSWRAFVAQYGPSRQAHARMIPLLEAEKQWKELAWVIERELELAPREEQSVLFSRLAQLRYSRLEEPEGALAALRFALEIDPKDAAARALAEKLLAAGGARLAAADVLEPIYRQEEPGTGLLRVLEARSELSPDEPDKLRAREEAIEVAAQVGDPARALELAARRLSDVARQDAAQIPRWLARVEQLASQTGKPAALAEILLSALGELPIASRELLELARAAGEALVPAGEPVRAIEAFRRALSFEPSSPELLRRIDELLAEQGNPRERLALYESALSQPGEPARRRELLHRLAQLQKRELGDLDAAIRTWREAIEEDPQDWVSHQALVDAYTERRDWRTLYAELERALGLQEGERRSATLARMAEVAAESGSAGRALEHYRELLGKTELADAVLQNIELLAHAEGDADTMRIVLERRIAVATEPEEQAQLLEKLGLVQAKQVADPEAAARSWMTGAALAEGAGDDERARRLYERVLGIVPDQPDAARRLIDLYARASAWQRLPEAYAVLLRVAPGDRETTKLLLALEQPAMDAGVVDVFVQLLDAALAIDGLEPARERQLSLAKARVLGASPAHCDEVAEIYRRVIASAGDEAPAAVEGFNRFLAAAESTSVRVSDRRWLFEWRAQHAADPASVLVAWAVAEESSFDSPQAAISLYERVLELAPDHFDAIAQLARLKADAGDAEGALRALGSLAEKSEGDARREIQKRIAAISIEQLGRPLDALAMIQELLEEHPADPEALRLAQTALGFDESRARAAAMLGRAAESAESPEARAEVLDALLQVSRGTAGLESERAAWWEQLLECRSEDPEAGLGVALRGAEERPLDDRMWDAAERFARKLDRPEPVADAYTRALDQNLAPEAAESLGRRMVEFQEEWFEEPERTVRLLTRVLELSPHAEWAFDRLKLAFNAQARWTDLFELYDLALSRSEQPEQRAELLREAAMAAKDFAGDAERAIGYLEQLNQLSPGDGRVESALERLYERGGHARSLIDLLDKRLASVSGRPALELRERIAGLWLDLEEAIPAWQLVESLLEEPEIDSSVHALLERLVSLPASRESILPAAGSSGGARHRAEEISVRHAAAHRLKQRYEAEGRIADVVRMLEVEMELAVSSDERVEWLSEIVTLKLDRLQDVEGAFENVAQLVAIEPYRRAHRERLAELAKQIGAAQRHAELLVQIADGCENHDLSLALLAEAAGVRQHELGDPAGASEVYRRVLDQARDRETALTAARELDHLLADAGLAEQRLEVLERLADLETEPERRRSALGSAARVAIGLRDADRAIKAWRVRLDEQADDVEALDGLAAALESAERWPELVGCLNKRAELGTSETDARRDRVRIATIQASELGDRAAAIDSWSALRASHGADRESFEALGALLHAEQRWPELAELYAGEAEREPDPSRQRELYRELGELHRTHTGEVGKALDAFVAAGDWERATEVSSAADGTARLELGQRLFELAVSDWVEGGSGELGAELGAGKAANAALMEITRRLAEEARHAELVEITLRAATLPFAREQRRRLERDAAVICSDRLADPERAIGIFRRLFAEAPGDEIARDSVTRFAALLEAGERFDEIASLWEQQARCRAEAGDTGMAAALFARAAELAEKQLEDLERAIADHRNGAGLGGEPSLEALARLYEQQGAHVQAAETLEWLCARSPREQLATRALRLADAYLRAGRTDLARARLEQAAATAIDAAAVRRRLAELYRELEEWEPLAELLTAEAGRAQDKKTRLALLRDAATLHASKRAAPEAAIPLLEQAIELDPDDSALRLVLADTFTRAGRFEEATETLRAQIERYGTRKPKDRALVHYHLARVSLAAGRRAEAIAELDVANKINPAHPAILQSLAKLAFEEGQLDRAERMYRALLLVIGRGDEPESPSRAEALLDLSEIAARSDDAARAAEFVESAFEAAGESGREAEALELALRGRERYDLLARAVESRLARASGPAEAARALGDLAFLHAERLGGLASVQTELRARADGVYRELETKSVTDDRAWSALGNVYDWLGDGEAEARVLERRVAAFAAGLPGPKQADAFYRLAEVRLAEPATRARGVEVLERALELAPDLSRAEAMLRAALNGVGNDERAARLLERVARSSGNQPLLAEALSLVSALPGFWPDALREGVDLACELDNRPLARSMLERALGIDASGMLPDDAAWVRTELASLHEQDGALGEALELREQAASFLAPADARAVLLAVAGRATSELADRPRAARIYEELLAREAADREVWEPLLDVYRELGDGERIVRLIEQTVPLVDSLPDRARLRFEQAKVLLDEGHTDDAIEILREIVELDPGQQSAAQMLSKIFESQGRHEELVGLLQSQLDAAKDRQDIPAIVQISLRLGALLEQQARPDDAFDVYLAVLDWDKSSQELLSAVLRLAERRDDPFLIADAIEGLLRVERGEPAVELASRLVALRDEQMDGEGAERALELGFLASPSTLELREPLLERYTIRGDREGLARVLRQAVEVAPGDRELVLRMVEAQREADQHSEGLVLLDQLVQAAPDDPELARARAVLLSDLGRDEEALEALERAYAASTEVGPELAQALERAVARAEPPQDRALTLRLIEVLEQSGDVEGARARLAELVKESPREREVVRLLAELEERAEHWDGAVAAYRRLIPLEEGEALVGVALRLADACERAGRFGDARGGLERALKAAPADTRVQTRLRALYEAVGANRELAQLVLEEAAAEQQVARRLELLLRAGELLLSPDGAPADAVRVLEEARGLSSESVEGVVLLARAYAAVGRGQESMTLLHETSLAHRGRRTRALASIHREMSRLQLEEGFLSEALQSLTKAFEMDMRNARLAMELGQLALDLDEDEVASRAFRAVTMLRPGDDEPGEGVTAELRAHAQFQLAVQAARKGDSRRAKVLVAKALSENPDHEQAKQLLAELESPA
jgi:golgin subfamily B member 1